MSLDERDYYYNPKQFRANAKPINDMSSKSEDTYWREIADRQQKLKRNLIILGIGAVALVWIFGGTIANYWKTFSWKETRQQEHPVISPRIIPPRPSTPELQFPESGSIIQYQQPTRTTAKFTVMSAQDKTDNCVVKLETWEGGIPTIELFVKVGEQAETRVVPLGNYRVKYACGKQWYGRSELFGKNTQISIGVQPLQFWKSGNTTYGNTLTLTQRIDGNFRTTESRFNKF